MQSSESIITPLIEGDSTSHSTIVHDLKGKVESLSQHIENLNEKHKKSEQEKEHWKVEYQLVQMKHDNLKDKLEGTGPELLFLSVQCSIILSYTQQ